MILERPIVAKHCMNRKHSEDVIIFGECPKCKRKNIFSIL